MLSTPSCVGLRSMRRERSSGPISDTVARIGCPFSPKRSQKIAGVAASWYSSAKPMSAARFWRKSFASPVAAMPERSPFTSAVKTGTPARGEALGQDLQRHRLAGAGRAGDEAVPVGEFQRPDIAARRGCRRGGGWCRDRWSRLSATLLSPLWSGPYSGGVRCRQSARAGLPFARARGQLGVASTRRARWKS